MDRLIIDDWLVSWLDCDWWLMSFFRDASDWSAYVCSRTDQWNRSDEEGSEDLLRCSVRSKTDSFSFLIAYVVGFCSRVYQTLPRHLRRRNMGWSVKRMPKRLKRPAAREVRGSDLSIWCFLCQLNCVFKLENSQKKEQRSKRYYRKYKRRYLRRRWLISVSKWQRYIIWKRPKFLLMNHARRQKQHHWLETHIWHAKRFKMIPKWGFKLAEYSRQRGVRAGYRAAAHQCTIYDCSYLCCIELVGKYITKWWGMDR